MKVYLKLFTLIIAMLLISACSTATQKPTQELVAPETETVGVGENQIEENGDDLSLAVEGFTKGGCVACHVIPGVPNAAGTIGPDLSEISLVAEEQLTSPDYTGNAKTVVEYLREALIKPDVHLSMDCPGGPCSSGLMPSYAEGTVSDAEITAMINFMARLPGMEISSPIVTEEPSELVETGLSDEDMEWAKQVYFERCAGCHGTLRKGATGPALTPDLMQSKGTLAMSAIIFNGTPRGMPDWGIQGFMTKEETEIMAEYLQMEPPQPPEMSLDQMLASWKLLVPPEDRPTEPQTTRNWENYMAVTLRDAGQVAFIDADTYEVVANVDTGYAVHISRNSATGRYVYTIGRDGKLALVDLWTEIPTKVAEAQLCYDARSVEVSKYSGELGDFNDKLAIVGC